MDKTKNLTVKVRSGALLTRKEFQQLASVPPEVEWFANIDNPRTRRAYRIDLEDFMSFVGIRQPEEFRLVTRSHVITWRKSLEVRIVSRGNSTHPLSGATIRRKLAALSSLFEFLCEKNAVTHNPVKGVKRPKVETYEGKTPALGDAQARRLLDAPDPDTVKGKRDRAILSVFLYHGVRLEELCKLMVRDLLSRRGVPHLRIHGKGNKIRYVPAHPATIGLIMEYAESLGHGAEPSAPLFQPVKNNRTGTLKKPLSSNGVYGLVRSYYKQIGLNLSDGYCAHSLRATAATNALDNEADITKVRDWLGHEDIATTTMYDKRKSRPEDSPTFKVNY